MTRETRWVVTDLPATIDRQCLLRVKITFDGHVKAGRVRHIINLDHVGEWQNEATTSIITILRTLRNAGGTLRLVTRRSDIRAALSLAGLDKILHVYTDEVAASTVIEDSTAKPGRALHVREASTRTDTQAFVVKGIGSLLALFLLLPPSASARAASVPQADASPGAVPTTDAREIVQRLIEREPDLQTYRAHLNVKIRMRSFPFLAPALEGQVYFKRPGKYEVIFDHVPFYAKGFERVYGGIGDPSDWYQRFDVSYSGQVIVSGHPDVVLTLVQRVRGMIDHERVMVDPTTWQIEQMEWRYYNGGVITMSQQYSNEDGFDMVIRQSADVRIPHVSAIAEANLSDYRTNVAIDDATFANNRR
ncbi:hypothetical protein EPN42_07310 [bacterium]|nr:MAG: hypothetical protein EPN42_07310 [bacterium]